MKIPYNQILFETIDWKCVDDCKKNNEEKLQALIDIICSLNTDGIDYGCLGNTDKSIKGAIKILIEKEKERCVSAAGINVAQFSFDTNKISPCVIDGWNYKSINTCIDVTSKCDEKIKLEDVINAIIGRVNSQSILIKDLNDKLIEMNRKYNELATITEQLKTKNNCCQ
jgi:hypothetical protein